MEIEKAIKLLKYLKESNGHGEQGDKWEPNAGTIALDKGIAALRAQAEREKAPETNFQRHFGTAENVAEFNKDIRCPPLLATSMKRHDDCKQCWLDWLNAPAEDK